MKIVLPILAAGVLVTGAAAVSTAAQTDSGSSRVTRVVVFGNDPCPRGSASEIVVCARKPETERYRIPEELRNLDDRPAESWAVRAESLETIGDTGIQSCSTVGPGGFTGCWAEMMRAAREERRRNRQPE